MPLTVIGPTPNCIDFSVPYSLLTRKIYAWIFATTSGANWWVKAQIGFWRQQSALGSLPLSIGGGTFGNQSLVSVCTSNGQNVQDCLGVYIANPPTGVTSLTLQPLYITGQFDRMTLSITDANGVTSIRGLMACISST